MTKSNLQTWLDYGDTRDPKALWDMLDESVVFHSPVVHSPQEGRQITALYLQAATGVLFSDDFHYVRKVVSGPDMVLEFVCVLDGITVNGVDMIRWNEAGKITDFKVMVRPLKGMEIVHRKMGEMLARMQDAKG